MTRYYHGTSGNDYARATKTRRWYWTDYWESWEMHGNAGNDTMIGGEADDFLFGYSGNDRLEGKGGDDYLNGDAGSDTMIGGTGNDTYVVDTSSDRIYEYSNGGSGDKVYSYTYSYSLSSYVEELYLQTGAYRGYGNGSQNRLIGNSLNNYLAGKGGDDYLEGHGGNDTLVGGSGGDRMLGGTGNDLYYVDHVDDYIIESSGSSGGFDTVRVYIDNYEMANHVEELLLIQGVAAHGNYTDNYLTGNSSFNFLYGDVGDDVLNGQGGADDLYGESGNDTLNGGTGSDDLYGGSDNDVLNGGADDDYLYGSTGDDTLNGEGGSDFLDGFGVGLTEYDTLTGGGDADIFVLGNTVEDYYLAPSYATITDFNRAEGDVVWVHGDINDYTLTGSSTNYGGSAPDTKLWRGSDLLAVFEDTTTVDLDIDFATAQVIVD